MGTWQQCCHESSDSVRRAGRRKQIAVWGKGRGCRSVGSCILPGKGQFVAFKQGLYKCILFPLCVVCSFACVTSDYRTSKEGNEGCWQRGDLT